MSEDKTTSLSNLDQDEFWDVARHINPRLTREQFDADWEEFQELKRAKGLH